MKSFLIQLLKVIKWTICGLCLATFILSMIGLLVTAKESSGALSPEADKYATSCAIAINWSLISVFILLLPEIIKTTNQALNTKTADL